jgi:thiamine pyrophosphokinase
MLNLYQQYAEENGVLPVPDHYSQDMEIALKMVQNQIGDEIIIYILVGITMVVFALFGWQRKKFMDTRPK